MSYYAQSAWTPMPYASTTRYAFGQDSSCDSAAEGVAGSQAAQGANWAQVASGGDMILTAQSGSTYSGAGSCDPSSYNEGYLEAWQLRCVTQGGTSSETADGYQCHVPARPTPTPTPGPSPAPTPIPAPSPPDSQALIASGPLFIAGALVVGVLLWKVFT